MRPAWTLPVSIIAAIAIGYLLLQFVKYPGPCWRGTTERPIDRSIDRSVVLWRLQKALSDSWKELSYKDDEVLLSKRLNMFAMEINQFICDLEDGVCGIFETSKKRNGNFLGRNNWRLVSKALFRYHDRQKAGKRDGQNAVRSNSGQFR